MAAMQYGFDVLEFQAPGDTVLDLAMPSVASHGDLANRGPVGRNVS